MENGRIRGRQEPARPGRNGKYETRKKKDKRRVMKGKDEENVNLDDEWRQKAWKQENGDLRKTGMRGFKKEERIRKGKAGIRENSKDNGEGKLGKGMRGRRKE